MKVQHNKFNTFGKRIEFVRTLCGLTQQQIAEAIDVSVGTWQRFVYGKSEMRRDTVRRFLEVTGADRDWVEGYSENLTLTMGQLIKENIQQLAQAHGRLQRVAARRR